MSHPIILSMTSEKHQCYHLRLFKESKLVRVEVDKIKWNESGDRAKLRVRTIVQADYGEGHGTYVYLMAQRDNRWLIHNYGMTYNQEPLEVQKDKAGLTPYDYALKYFAAMNEGDLKKLRGLHSEEFMTEFCSVDLSTAPQ